MGSLSNLSLPQSDPAPRAGWMVSVTPNPINCGKEARMSKLTDQINAFDQKLRSVESTKRTVTDNVVTQLSRFLLELSQRVDRMTDEDVEM